MKTLMSIVLSLFFTLIAFSQNNDCGCCSEKHAEFDFWIGNWNVTNPDGTTAGTNKIDKI